MRSQWNVARRAVAKVGAIQDQAVERRLAELGFAVGFPEPLERSLTGDPRQRQMRLEPALSRGIAEPLKASLQPRGEAGKDLLGMNPGPQHARTSARGERAERTDLKRAGSLRLRALVQHCEDLGDPVARRGAKELERHVQPIETGTADGSSESPQSRPEFTKLGVATTGTATNVRTRSDIPGLASADNVVSHIDRRSFAPDGPSRAVMSPTNENPREARGSQKPLHPAPQTSFMPAERPSRNPLSNGEPGPGPCPG